MNLVSMVLCLSLSSRIPFNHQDNYNEKPVNCRLVLYPRTVKKWNWIYKMALKHFFRSQRNQVERLVTRRGVGALPYKSFYLLLILFLVHDIGIYLNAGLSVKRMSFKICLVHGWVHIQALGPKMIGARDVRYYALSALSLPRHSHPHVPIPENIRSRPLCLEFTFV